MLNVFFRTTDGQPEEAFVRRRGKGTLLLPIRGLHYEHHLP